VPADRRVAESPAQRCAVLAGGRGERIGGQKALVPLAGRPLIEHVLEAVAVAGLVPLLLAKPETALATVSLGEQSILREPAEPTHPLLGIATALESVGRPLVVCPCDMPLLPGALLAHLAARPEPQVTLSRGGRLEPLVGRYSPEAAPSLREAAEAGLPARETVADLEPVVLAEPELSRFGDPARIMRSVNDRDGLREVERLLAAQAD
jgi:molybdopterin-guanine dinucleotide biosynthesis protein A